MLKGLKVVEYATYIAAPGAGGLLADWGADVVKVEPPGGDPIRKFFETIGAEAGINPVFELDNRGKRSIVLDTSKPDGQAALTRLAAEADVFLTNVRPGGLARAGLDPETLMAANPRLVYASVTGYGLTGPEADRPGFDITAFWARSGVAAATIPKGVEPFPIRTGMGDHVTSMATLSGILAALYDRERTGKGRLVEASLLRAGIYALGSDMAIQLAFGRLASTRPRAQAVQPLANFFRTRDGRWLVLVPRQTGEEWSAIRRALSLEALDGDARFATAKARRQNGAALVAALDDAFAQIDFADVTDRLDTEGLVWAPVQTAAEVVVDAQAIAAGAFVNIPQADEKPLPSPAGPIRFPGLDCTPSRAAPAVGAHTREVLSAIGFDDAAIDAMLESGAAM